MGDLAHDTAVAARGGSFRATLSRDWEIWGPNGGYVAAVALRAAGVASRFTRPASIALHFLSVARFGDVDLDVVSLRQAKKAESLRVTMSQDGNAVLEALVWTVSDDARGLVHDTSVAPTVPPPAECIDVDARLAASGLEPNFAFWRNIEERALVWIDNWEEREAGDASVRMWCRFRPTASFPDDPFAEAARYLVLADTMQWPAAVRAHRGMLAYQAPTIDLQVSFHELAPASEWLLVDAAAPVARDGLIGGRAAIWSREGRLLASGGGQLLCRPAVVG